LPPCWVKATALYQALSGMDSASRKSRGFLIVGGRPAGVAAQHS